MTAEDIKSVVFLLRKAPYASSIATAATDIILTSAIFNQNVSIVFAGEGIYQLLKEQNSSALNVKNLSQVFPALELYEVENVLVEQESLELKGLTTEDLLIPVELVKESQLSHMLELADQVFCF